MDPSPEPRFLQRAIELALESVREGLGGPFGAVVVRDGRVVATGTNRVTSSGDPTAHAEVVAIRAACAALGTHVLAGCELYSSCEPCPMCLAAMHWARIERFWYGATRHDAARIGFDDERLYEELARPAGERSLPSGQLLREAALAAFREWEASPDHVPY